MERLGEEEVIFLCHNWPMKDAINGVVYVPVSKLTWSRKKKGKGFVYVDKTGELLRKLDVDRVENLKIPPAWRDVRINPNKNGHIQVLGLDDKGRKQYIYHPIWTVEKQRAKFDDLVGFGEVLPVIRETVRGHMRQHDLSRDRVLATVVWLLENTFIRVGNEVYENENGSYGLTTMREKHVDVEGAKIKFAFKGKSKVYHQLSIKHPRVAETIKKCLELPGYRIFQYIGEDGDRKKIYAQEVNEYLKRITGKDLSAKDFRTWGGTTIGARNLYEAGEPESEVKLKKILSGMYRDVSEYLGNTPSVCRKYYVHPKVVESYEQNRLIPYFKKVMGDKESGVFGLTDNEFATWRLISRK